MQGLFGLVVFCAIAWAFSEQRSRVAWRVVGAGLALQFVLALLLLKIPGLKDFFIGLNSLVLLLDRATGAGTAFVFGFLGGGPAPYSVDFPQSAFVLAFRALPVVLVVSALSALLFYWRVLPFFIRLFSRLLSRTMGISGALALGCAANIFVGMVEAPLIIRPYLNRLSRGELFALMTVGMATIAGTVMVLYAGILGTTVPNALSHILIASILSVPAALCISAILLPWDHAPPSDHAELTQEAHSSMDAITRGTMAGVQLYLNIIAMLVVLVALVSLVNLGLEQLPYWHNEPLSLQRILGWIMAPLVWLCGIPWREAATAGGLMGIKTVLNELLAYVQMAQLGPEQLSPRSQIIMTYALCGFANFGSLGIMLGGLATMAPQRSDVIAGLGMKSILAGTLSTLMTGAVVSLFL